MRPLAVAIGMVVSVALSGSPASAQSSATRSASPSVEPRAVLDRYCTGCHNEKLKSGGLALDNIAGVLKLTPSLLDRYMVAARQISRVAVGNPALPPTAETFRLKSDLSQDFSFDDLPMGTRGGTAIRYHFPLDADYVIKIEP